VAVLEPHRDESFFELGQDLAIARGEERV